MNLHVPMYPVKPLRRSCYRLQTATALNPSESLRAATAGGAAALELADGRGTLAPGAPADLVLWRAQSAAEIPYRLAAPTIEGVWKAGERVV